jgi:hypothetical protein
MIHRLHFFRSVNRLNLGREHSTKCESMARIQDSLVTSYRVMTMYNIIGI